MFKPLLAAAADMSALRFPYLATPKIDGIRCLIFQINGAVSRNLKPIPNRYIRDALADRSFAGLDGELLTYTDGVRDDFNTAQGNIMRADGKPEFKLLAFDCFDMIGHPYSERVQYLNGDFGPFIEPLLPVEIANMAALDAYEADCVDRLGWEGIMLRRPDGPYKTGRSTAKEGTLLKVKRFTDDEAEITGLVEQNENTNEATRNVFGRTERSSAKAGMVGKGTLGALQCRWKGVDFQVGTGMTQAIRDDLWAQAGRLVGQRVTFKYQGVGTNGAPRFPVFKGIRQD